MATRDFRFINLMGVNTYLLVGTEQIEFYAGIYLELSLNASEYESLQIIPYNSSSIPSIDPTPLMLEPFSQSKKAIMFLGQFSEYDKQELCGYGYMTDGVPTNATTYECNTSIPATLNKGEFIPVGDESVSMLKRDLPVEVVYIDYTNVDAEFVKKYLATLSLYKRLRSPIAKGLLIDDIAMNQQQGVGSEPQKNRTEQVLFITLIFFLIVAIVVVISYIIFKVSNPSKDEYGLNNNNY